MPSVTTPLDTARLRLRPFATTDLDALANILARPDVMEYLDEEPMTRPEVARLVEQRVTQHRLDDQGDTLWLAIECRETGEMIGTVHLVWLSQEHAQGEVGYRLHPDHWGRGYASEAVTAIMEYGFREIELHRVVGTCDDRNTPSQRLLERIGMRQEGHFREVAWVKGEWRSQLLYAMLRHEWDERQG